MAKALAQSRRQILPFLPLSRWWLEQSLEQSTWLLKLEAKSPGISCVRFFSTQAASPAQTQRMGAVKVSMTSPGFLYEPYSPHESMPFWYRYFTRSGWKRTKEDIISELKNAYAIAKLRKSGYSKRKFYEEVGLLYKEINTLMANGDKGSLRKLVTESMYSALKNEIKQRETVWSHVYWEMFMPIVKIRTLRARLIGVDRDDLNKVFAQLTLEFLSKQKFEAYDSSGAVVAGNKDKETLPAVYSGYPTGVRYVGPEGPMQSRSTENYMYWSQIRYLCVIYGFLRNLFSTKERTGVFVEESKYSFLFRSGISARQFC